MVPKRNPCAAHVHCLAVTPMRCTPMAGHSLNNVTEGPHVIIPQTIASAYIAIQCLAPNPFHFTYTNNPPPFHSHYQPHRPMESMEAAATCEITRLPEELLSMAISLTTPLDACRAAVVSRAFCAAADSDAVWSCFLPHNLPSFLDEELSRAELSNKERFLRLADHPVVLADSHTSMWLDKETGVKCFMLSGRKMNITFRDRQFYYRWSGGCWCGCSSYSFSTGAAFMHLWWLEMRDKIYSNMLSQNTTYCAYLVFSIAHSPHGLERQEQDTYFSLGGTILFRRVRLNDSIHRVRIEGCLEAPQNVLLPRERGDGWKEVELGEFYNDEGEDGEICITLNDASGTLEGLIIYGVEMRPKKQG